jgi:hypothetical protein
MYLCVFSRLDECLTKTIKANWLLFIDQRRTAYSLGFKVDRNLHPVGDPYERNAAVHPKVLSIKSHDSFDIVKSCLIVIIRERQRFGFRYSSYRKRAGNRKGIRSGRHHFV